MIAWNPNLGIPGFRPDFQSRNPGIVVGPIPGFMEWHILVEITYYSTVITGSTVIVEAFARSRVHLSKFQTVIEIAIPDLLLTFRASVSDRHSLSDISTNIQLFALIFCVSYAFLFCCCIARYYTETWRIFHKVLYRIRLCNTLDGAQAATRWFV